MSKQKQLKYAYQLSRGVKIKTARINGYRDSCERATSVATAVRISGTSKRSNLENCMCIIDELEREIKKDREEIFKITQCIKTISTPVYRQILEMRYVDGMQWDEIAHKLGYSKQHVYRLHGWALHDLKLESK